MFCFKCGASLNGVICANCNTNNAVVTENNYMKSNEIAYLLKGDSDRSNDAKADGSLDRNKCGGSYSETIPNDNAVSGSKLVYSEIKKEEKVQPVKEKRAETVILVEDVEQKKTQTHRKLNYKRVVALAAGVLLCGGVGFYLGKSCNKSTKNTNNDPNDTSDNTTIDPVSSETTTGSVVSIEETTTESVVFIDETTTESAVSTDEMAAVSTVSIDELTSAETNTTESTEQTTETGTSTTSNVTVTTKRMQYYIRSSTAEKTTETRTTRYETSTEAIEFPITTKSQQENTFPIAPGTDPVTTHRIFYMIHRHYCSPN